MPLHKSALIGDVLFYLHPGAIEYVRAKEHGARRLTKSFSLAPPRRKLNIFRYTRMPSNPRRKLQTWLCLVNCDVRSSLSLLAMDKATIYSFSWVIFHPVSTLSFSILSWVFFFAFVLAGQSACRINQSCADDLMW